MKTAMRLAEVASAIDCTLQGDPGVMVNDIAGLELADANQLSLFVDPRLTPALETTRAAALIVSANFDRSTLPRPIPLLCAANPSRALALAIELLRPPWRPSPGIDAKASIDPSATIGADCHVGPFAVIGANCLIGNGCFIYPHAVLYPEVSVGDRCTIHAHAVLREGTRLANDVVLQPGVVLGGDGFGFYKDSDGRQAKIAQVGRVEVGNRVEIQANSCIDRATLDATRVGDGTRIDNLVQVAHNCEIGEEVVLCSQVGLAGSTRVGKGAILAGQVGVAGHCTIGEGTIITAQSGTHGDLDPGKMYSGSPAFDHGDWLRSTAVFARLGDLHRQLRELRARLTACDGGSPN